MTTGPAASITLRSSAGSTLTVATSWASSATCAHARLMRKAAAAFRTASELPLQTCATLRWIPGVGSSDHAPFWRQGYRAFMVTDTAYHRNPYYHTAGDVPRRRSTTAGSLRAADGLAECFTQLAANVGREEGPRIPVTDDRGRAGSSPPRPRPGPLRSAAGPADPARSAGPGRSPLQALPSIACCCCELGPRSGRGNQWYGRMVWSVRPALSFRHTLRAICPTPGAAVKLSAGPPNVAQRTSAPASDGEGRSGHDGSVDTRRHQLGKLPDAVMSVRLGLTRIPPLDLRICRRQRNHRLPRSSDLFVQYRDAL